MTIYVVKQGDTLDSIAQQFGVTAARLILDNELPNPDNLVVGQSIVVRVPNIVHTVVQGDTLASIAATYDITVTKLLQNNPWAAAEANLIPGQNLVISFRDEGVIDTALINGYAYPFINRQTLSKTLPFLTFLSIFTYGFTPQGDLVPIDDEELIAAALEAGDQAIMMLAPMNASQTFDTQIAHEMFNNAEGQATLINNIVANIQAKGYSGLDIDFEYVQPEDKQGFLDFISAAKNTLSPLGYLTLVALAPKTSGEQTGLLYEAHDYPAIGAIADFVLLMTYEWGYTYSSPMATAPLNNVRRVLNYGVSVIPREKIFMGIPNYAYDWPLPFVRGETAAETISNQEAIITAAKYNAVIQFDELAQAPFFYYTNEEGIEHVVWFDDARSMDAKFRLIPELSLRGAGIWQIMDFFPGMCMVINQLFTVEKGVKRTE